MRGTALSRSLNRRAVREYSRSGPGLVTGQSLQELFESRIRAPYGLDFHLGLPAGRTARVQDIRPMLPTPGQQAELKAAASSPQSLTGIAFNRNAGTPLDLVDWVNTAAVREKCPASVGGVASARGLAKMYAAAISEVDGRAALLKPDTVAEFGQIHSAGFNLVTRHQDAFALGFEALSDRYPALGQGAFGHAGAGGQQALADPRSGISYGYTRRRFAFPGGPAPENDRLIRAVLRGYVRTTQAG